MSTKNETIAASSLRVGELEIGDLVGPYLIEACQSRGASAVVYRGKRSPDGVLVAIKVLHRAYADAPGAISRFQAEISLLRSLSHPGIVETFDVGSLPDGRPYVVMEWLSGQTIDELRLEGPMPLPRAVSLMGKLCDVLKVVHEAGIVHRDLKGANVMVVLQGAEERVKLLDFGVAKLVGEKSSLTLAGTRIGTPSHMAPEQILGGRISPQTDIYALGVILYSMLTASLPFSASSPLEVEEKHLDERPPSVSSVVRVPPLVNDVIRRCLAKKALQRHGSVSDFMEELEHAARAEEVPPSSLRSGRATAVGVFVSVEGLDPVSDKALEDARRIFADEGIEPALEDEAGRWLLFVTGISRGPRVPAVLRERALLAALDVVGSAPSGALVRAVVHVAPVMTLSVEGALQVVGGELLACSSWAAGSEPSRVEASREALLGLTAELAPGREHALDWAVVQGIVPVSMRRAR